MAWGTRFLKMTCGSYTMGMPVSAAAKAALVAGRIYGEELFGHEGLGHDKVLTQSLQYVEDPRYVVDQRNVDRLNLWPKWKTPVGDDQGIRMPNATYKRVDGGIEDACLEHATRVT